MKRFQIYKVVRNGRLMHITSYAANDRKEAIELFKKDNKSAKIGLYFWNYYVSGLTHFYNPLNKLICSST